MLQFRLRGDFARFKLPILTSASVFVGERAQNVNSGLCPWLAVVRMRGIEGASTGVGAVSQASCLRGSIWFDSLL